MNNELIFKQIINNIWISALVHVGAEKNPNTDKYEVNLNQAELWLNTLKVLQTKTKNNLSFAEEKYITEKIAYIEKKIIACKGA